MIEEQRGRIEYEEAGSGPTLILVPGSCSTGAAWRPVMKAIQGQFRFVTTSLLGYGETAERRTVGDPSILYEAEVLEAVIRKAGGPVHLVGHSFGGSVSLIVAMRKRVEIASLVILEAPVPQLLQQRREHAHYRAFRTMTGAYFAAYGAGDREAIRTMIDFYGGLGTYASWPQRVRDYAVEKTPVNLLDWACAYDFSLTPDMLGAIDVPVTVVVGADSHPAVRQVNAIITESIGGADLVAIEGAAHFMIATHAERVGALIAGHVGRVERLLPDTFATDARDTPVRAKAVGRCR